MNKTAFVCPVLLIAATVSPGDAATQSEGAVPTVQEILASPLDDQAYSNTTRCLAMARYRRVEIVGDQALVFHGRGDNAWLNVLPRRCAGLRPHMVLALERSVFRVCAMDRFKGLPRGSTTEFGTGICSLGTFEHMTSEQVQARSDALLERQRNRIVARTLRSARRPKAKPTPAQPR